MVIIPFTNYCYEAQTSQIVLGVKSGSRLSKQVGGIKPAGFTRQDLKNYIVTKKDVITEVW